MQNIRFPAKHHSTMLCDKNRLISFRNAINKAVNQESIVVDIGTGTGILAHFAAMNNPKQVVGIEYITATYEFAKKISQKLKHENISFLNQRSYDVKLNNSPNLLLTETIGPIGPEENIVELSYDFCKRHPTISTIIPANLEIFAQPFWSTTVENNFNNVLNGYSIDNCESFVLDSDLRLIIEDSYCVSLIQGYLLDAIRIGPEISIVKYNLGIDKSSEFDFQSDFSNHAKFNGVYLFFKSMLIDGVHLTNHFQAERNHWVPYYVRKHDLYDKLSIKYDSHSRIFNISWS